jgi:hypothetical protein
MYNPLQHVFFIIYQWNKKFAPKSDQPVLNSILALSVLMFCNLITLSLVIELISGFKIISFEGITVINVIVVIVAIIFLNFFLLGFESRYSSIIDKYSKRDVIKGYLGVVIYILLSIAAFLFVLFYIAGKASR